LHTSPVVPEPCIGSQHNAGRKLRRRSLISLPDVLPRHLGFLGIYTTQTINAAFFLTSFPLKENQILIENILLLAALTVVFLVYIILPC